MKSWLLVATALPLFMVPPPSHAKGSSDQVRVGQDSGNQLSRDAYKRAEAALPQHIDDLVTGMSVRPQWFEDSNRFWYEKVTHNGREYIVVDPVAGSVGPLFDHGQLLAQLNRATKQKVTVTDFRLRNAELDEEERALEFKFADRNWRVDLASSKLSERPKSDDVGVASPDGKLRAFNRNHNLWVKDEATGQEKQLTFDGTAARPYARPVLNVKRMIAEGSSDPDLQPDIQWSPDSRKIATYKLDLTGARRLAIVQSTPPKNEPPRVFDYYYTFTGDKTVPLASDVMIDVASGGQITSKAPPQPILYYGGPFYEWSKDSTAVFRRAPARGYKTMRLDRLDAQTGEVKRLREDRSDTYIDYYGHHWSYDDKHDRHFWTADPSGFAHIYTVDGRTGKNLQLTRGNWRARSVEGTSPDGKRVFVVGSGKEGGRDPYLRSLYAASIDGKTLVPLTPEALDHDVSVSPDGRFFVDNMSLINKPTVSVLRSTVDGRVVMELGRADISKLSAAGFTLPEPFEALATDGKTKLYGAIYKPADFSPAKRYPVIEYIYTGPHHVQTPKSFESALKARNTLSLAQLGAIGVTIDGRGTWGRSRAFQQVAYKNLHKVGLDDHVSAIQQIAKKNSFIDASKVGIYGFSAGGYDVVRAMTRRPDFYKVGVSASGNHDNRLDKATWNEQWMDQELGALYDENSNVTWAPKLEGQLFLAHGELDENVPTAATLRLVDALMKANKDFEFLIVPNADHFLDESPYFQRRRWDFFTEQLLGKTPPVDYKMKEFDK